MSPEERKRLTWEDATQRFLEVAELGPADRQGPLTTALDKAAWSVFNGLTGALALPPPAVGMVELNCNLIEAIIYLFGYQQL